MSHSLNHSSFVQYFAINQFSVFETLGFKLFSIKDVYNFLKMRSNMQDFFMSEVIHLLFSLQH